MIGVILYGVMTGRKLGQGTPFDSWLVLPRESVLSVELRFLL